MLGHLTMADRLASEMASLFGRAAYPPLNVWEDAANVVVEAELPGVSINDVDVSITGSQLTLRGERKADAKAWNRQERFFGAFERTLALPVAVDAAKVEAAFKNGVLTITMPKAEAARPRRIEVKVR